VHLEVETTLTSNVWSPDSTSYTFERNGNIYTVNMEGDEIELTVGPNVDKSPQWIENSVSLLDTILVVHPKTAADVAKDLLLDLGYDFSQRAFMSAVGSGDSLAVDYFIETGIDLNYQERDKYGETFDSALTTAAAKGDTTILKMLLQAGAHPNIAYGYGGIFALLIAASKNYLETVHLLVEFGANVNQSDIDGKTALIDAIQEQNIEIIQFLIENGADVNWAQYNGNYLGSIPLEIAVSSGSSEIVNLLLESGANPHINSDYGITLLMLAASKPNIEIVDLLIQQNIDINTLDNQGRSALSYAVINDHMEMAQYLVTVHSVLVDNRHL
jgi:uncharacterized protein